MHYKLKKEALCNILEPTHQFQFKTQTFFDDFEENQLTEGDVCTGGLPELLTIII